MPTKLLQTHDIAKLAAAFFMHQALTGHKFSTEEGITKAHISTMHLMRNHASKQYTTSPFSNLYPHSFNHAPPDDITISHKLHDNLIEITSQSSPLYCTKW